MKAEMRVSPRTWADYKKRRIGLIYDIQGHLEPIELILDIYASDFIGYLIVDGRYISTYDLRDDGTIDNYKDSGAA